MLRETLAIYGHTLHATSKNQITIFDFASYSGKMTDAQLQCNLLYASLCRTYLKYLQYSSSASLPVAMAQGPSYRITGIRNSTTFQYFSPPIFQA